MIPKTGDPLMDVLADLSVLYPEMRFGQLVEMVALLSGPTNPPRPAEVDDDGLLKSAAKHLRTRRRQLQVMDGAGPGAPLPESRAELIQVLEGLRHRRSEWGFGRLVEHLATSAGPGLYDAEDEQLIAEARRLSIGQAR